MVRSSTFNFCGNILKKSKVIHGNCLKVMPNIPNDCVDTVITDPPYGLKFMSKGWDHVVPGPHYWRECLRVSKPGAILMAFGGTRTYHRLTCAIEDAGWEIRDCIQWIYGSGFPKSLDVSKALDELHFKKWLKANPKYAKKYRKQLSQAKESGSDAEQHVIHKYKRMAGAYREVVGHNENHREGKGGPSGTRCGLWSTEHAQPHTGEGNITTPATELATQWDGWGTALKPSWEPIIVAMKPLDGTFAENAEKWGVAGLNIDGGRIGTEARINKGMSKRETNGAGVFRDDNWQPKDIENTAIGRFPANTILDEEAAAMLDKQSGISGGDKTTQRKTLANRAETYSGFENCSGEVCAPNNYAGMGGASRFFYTAKASKSERNAGCGELEFTRHHDDRTPGGPGGDNPRNRTNIKKQNFHPTVKPLALMEYLCRLTRTPTGGIVLDPFAGSGTTALACLNTHRKYIMIEEKKKYYNIMKARIRGRKKNRRLLDE